MRRRRQQQQGYLCAVCCVLCVFTKSIWCIHWVTASLTHMIFETWLIPFSPQLVEVHTVGQTFTDDVDFVCHPQVPISAYSHCCITVVDDLPLIVLEVQHEPAGQSTWLVRINRSGTNLACSTRFPAHGKEENKNQYLQSWVVAYRQPSQTTMV